MHNIVYDLLVYTYIPSLKIKTGYFKKYNMCDFNSSVEYLRSRCLIAFDIILGLRPVL